MLLACVSRRRQAEEALVQRVAEAASGALTHEQAMAKVLSIIPADAQGDESLVKVRTIPVLSTRC